MKKILFMGAIASAILTGCATDKAYNLGKAVYKGGKVVVQDIEIDEEKKEKLKKIDKGLVVYDKARTVIRGQLDQGKLNASTSNPSQN